MYRLLHDLREKSGKNIKQREKINLIKYAIKCQLKLALLIEHN